MKKSEKNNIDRRKFIKQCVVGSCGLALGAYTINDFFIQNNQGGRLRIGFYNDAPSELWTWSREADWYEVKGRMIRCNLCPHLCILGENDRGFCRVRVVKEKKLHSLVYGNPCAVHIDPVEKKPLFHFLPGTPIFSVATAGCNLRCINCQNWEISQSRPEETVNADLLPARMVNLVSDKNIPSIAYTYSEPIVFYEYVKDSSILAKESGIRNILVTAGYISEKPLRELCKVIDAANVDLKAFSDRFYKKVTESKLDPVLNCLQVMREEGVWLEVTRLIVPSYSNNMEDIKAMCNWLVQTLGPDIPLHLSRFHPAYKLRNLPPTPATALDRAREIALDAGLHYVYVGNIPGHPAQHTVCPQCGRRVIERRGYQIQTNLLNNGICPCGESIPGFWI